MKRNRRRRRNWLFGILAFLAVGIAVYALLLYGNPDDIQDQGFVTAKGTMPDLWYTVLWFHAVSGGIGLGIGWLQFIKRIRLRAPNVHRAFGYVYATMIGIAGVTGLYMAYYTSGGLSAQLGFGALSLMWLYTLYQSLKSIIADRNPRAHGQWMLRNYALSCAAISLRIMIPLAAVFWGLTDTNDTFGVIAWICWLPNLLLAEMIIRTGIHNYNRSKGAMLH
ncbi:DUF2306 domain-containing protein [Paenibacillus oryzisoli]|uniref:DUF2306 domain-containing protein n=1 Tax=Paenibacillus oryzisoli TaxID=1850517 RepID=UPI000AB53D34|nr:DUF2306 domain-containing protein [Paenibacillus oryzisoli]